jgi:hypothetical protein
MRSFYRFAGFGATLIARGSSVGFVALTGFRHRLGFAADVVREGPLSPGHTKPVCGKPPDFIEALYNDFQEHGSAAIAACRAEKPDVYVRIIAGILPKDVHLKVQSLDELTDDQLLRKLAVLTEMAKPLLARLPTVIDVEPVGVDVGVTSATAKE